MPKSKLRVEYVDPHELKHFPGNPRIMPDVQKEALHRSTERWGFVEPLVVRQGNEVVGGNQRLDEALASRLKKVPIVRIRVNDTEAKALNLALNKIHGEWNEELLAPILLELKDLPEVQLTGFQPAEIEKLLSSIPVSDLKETTERAKSQGLSLVPYLGGKQAVTPYLISLLPEHTSYVEVFGGAAALLLNKPPSPIEVYNDLDGEIVNLFEVIRNDIEGFMKHSDFLLHSRELYEKWSREINSGQIAQDAVERAVRYWYCLNTSFAAVVGKGWAYARAEPRSHADQIIGGRERARQVHERIKRVEIDHLDFARLIDNRDSPSTLFFLDPPYLKAEEYRIGTFHLEDHKRLAERLARVQGNWLMTIGDAPEIRSLYPGQIKGSLNTVNSTDKVIASEGQQRENLVRNLIIANYALPHGMPRS
jgi:DNA adenine methylase